MARARRAGDVPRVGYRGRRWPPPHAARLSGVAAWGKNVGKRRRA
ncbi:hypothetical protein DA2_1883 [Desulfovibrio sp. A2]|nr:hypothetical protein DA2_1883 [Desulfovibrio sp. A2]